MVGPAERTLRRAHWLHLQLLRHQPSRLPPGLCSDGGRRASRLPRRTHTRVERIRPRLGAGDPLRSDRPRARRCVDLAPRGRGLERADFSPRVLSRQCELSSSLKQRVRVS
jgi:hypothetical protein